MHKKTIFMLSGIFAVLFLCLLACKSGGSVRTGKLAVGEFPENAADITVFTQVRHEATVLSVAYSPDGKLALTGSVDNTIKLIDLESGREIRLLLGHTQPVTSVAFSPDMKYIISGSGNTGNSLYYNPNREHVDPIKLWDAATGEIIRTFPGHTGNVLSVTFSPDSTQFVSISKDNTVRLWEVESGKLINTLPWSGRQASASFSPDGRQIAFGDVNAIYFSSDGKQLILASAGRSSLFVYDTVSGLEVSNFSVEESGFISWDIGSGQKIKNVSNISFGYYGDAVVTFSTDHKRALMGKEEVIELRDIENGRLIRRFPVHIREQAYSVTFSPDGRHFLSGHARGFIKLWDTESGQEIDNLIGLNREITGRVTAIDFSPNGKQIIFSTNNRSRVLDAESGREIISIGRFASYSPDGKLILSTGPSWSQMNGIYQITFVIYDVATGQIIKRFHIPMGEIQPGWNQPGFIETIDFSPDGKHFLFSMSTTIIRLTGDSVIKIWDIENDREVISFLGGHRNWYSPDGKNIFSLSHDSVKLFDVATGEEIRTFIEKTRGIISGCLSHDGKTIAVGFADGTTRLWDVATGNEIAAFISLSGSDTQLTAASRGLLVEETESAASSIDSEWLTITPDGYYQASPRGDRAINVRVGNTVSGIDSYRSIFYNPDVVQARLQGRPDPASKAMFTIQEAANFTPPSITIQSPANFSTTTTASTSLSVNISDQNQPLQNIRVFVNGRPAGREELEAVSGLATEGGVGLQAGRSGLTVTGNQKTVNFTMPLELEPGSNFIEVVAFNGFSENRRHVDVTWNAPAGQRSALPNLWILAIGVNQYDNAGPRMGGMGSLNFAVADAKALVDSLKAQEGRRYAKVNTLLIADGESLAPTTENIRKNLAFLDQAGDRDVVLLFLAGHGLSAQGGQFFFLPKDAAVSGAVGNLRVDEGRAISGDEITTILEGHGRRLLLIDACNSGGVDSNRMIRGFMESNAFVFASSQGSELSYESRQWGGGHGVFTYSVLNALRGAPAALAGNNVSVRSMSGFVSLEVPRQTQNRQNPRVHSLLFGDFPLAEINK